jgi:hypothetical protein
MLYAIERLHLITGIFGGFKAKIDMKCGGFWAQQIPFMNNKPEWLRHVPISASRI